MEKSLSNECPYCSGTLKVDRMACQQCGVAIEGSFPASRLGHLPIEHQRFIEMFVLASGNLKVIATETGISYPTVRSRLNKVIDAVRGEIAQTVKPHGSILDAIAEPNGSGTRRQTPSAPIDPDIAAQLIKSI